MMISKAKEMSQGLMNKKIRVSDLFVAVMAVMMLAVFINSSYSLYFGPFIAAILVYLFFSGHEEFSIAVIMTANDALGTIAFGSISFPYLLLALVLFKLLTSASFNVKRLIFILVSAAFLFELFAVEFISLKMLIYTVTYVIAIASMKLDESHESLRRFFAGVAFTVVIIALHATLTGGVEYYELVEGSKEFLRKGVLGVGIGDSNYSGFLLNIGIICLWYFTTIGVFWKIVFTAPIIYAMILTLSTSALLSLMIILALSILLMKKKSKALLVLVIALLVLVGVFQFYIGLPGEARIAALDAYIERMEEKIVAFSGGDYTSATTHRSDISSAYLKYIFEGQSIFRFLFGGNTLIINVSGAMGYAPHNTYIGVLLQFGMIGAALFFGYVVKRFIEFCRTKGNPNFRPILIFKILCLFMATNISIYEGSVDAIWMLVLLLL